MTLRAAKPELSDTKRKLIDAGVQLMRAQGYNATTVDDICATAGVTKGGFFHYFKSKDDLAKAAVLYFRDSKQDDSEQAPFRQLADPLDRIFARLEFVKESVGGTTRLTKGCLIGMFAQELSSTHPELRRVCQESLLQMADNFERDLVAAKAAYAPTADFDPKRLAMFYVSIFQGSSLLAKASENNAVLIDNLTQFGQYLTTLFGQSPRFTKAGVTESLTNQGS